MIKEPQKRQYQLNRNFPRPQDQVGRSMAGGWMDVSDLSGKLQGGEGIFCFIAQQITPKRGAITRSLYRSITL